jgi:hypothetical protein
MVNDSMGASGALARIAAALLLVIVTFNPSGYSFYHWVAVDPLHPGAVQLLAGVALLICWVIYVTATMRSLGLIGVVLLLALFGALVWLAVEQGWLQLGANRAMAWIGLLAAGLILGVGMCWSFVRRRLSGQADVDQVDTR